MRTQPHANAAAAPRTRAGIRASTDPVAVLAGRHGVPETTIRRRGGRAAARDGGRLRHTPGQATTPLDGASIAELRTPAGLGLGDVAQAMNRRVHPGLPRGSVGTAPRRPGRAGGPAAGPGPPPGRRRASPPPFRARSTPGSPGPPIEPLSRHWSEARWRGAEFTGRLGGGLGRRRDRPSGRRAFDRLRAAHGVGRRPTRPRGPRTNGMAERFDRRIAEAIAGHPRFRGGADPRAAFAVRAERAAYPQDSVEACNRTGLRRLGHHAPEETLNNQRGDNTRTGASIAPAVVPEARLRHNGQAGAA